ncbi:MAG: MBL fold metallo-hydrolase [Acidimicrobiales bacterium]|nr:MBL fold metallo-hydrolase [Acidimicrobiales bacterium]
MSPTFLTELDIEYGRVDQLSPLVRRVVADNPGKFTFKGTGTYLIGHGDHVAVIDPGPRDPDHVAAILAATKGETISHVLITHTHGDHSPGRILLADHTDAPTFGFGPHPAAAVSEEADDALFDLPELDEATTPPTGDEEAPRSEEEIEADLRKHRPDTDFVPDETIADGDAIETPHWTVTAVHTPGHISNHLCFALTAEHALFSGDHVMGWSTTIIPPPDGSMASYLDSLDKVLRRTEDLYYPTHGPPIPNAHPFVTSLRDHRLERERQIIDQLAQGERTIGELVAVLYTHVGPELHRPAARSVLAHLGHLEDLDRVVRSAGTPPRFSLV